MPEKLHPMPSERQDRRDLATIHEIYRPPLTRCAGNRLIAAGRICPHCDSSDPPRDCKAPARRRSKRDA